MRLTAFLVAALLAAPAAAATIVPGSTSSVGGIGDRFTFDVTHPVRDVFRDSYFFDVTTDNTLRFVIRISEDPESGGDRILPVNDQVLFSGPGVFYIPDVAPFRNCCGPNTYAVSSRQAGLFTLNVDGFGLFDDGNRYFGSVEVVTPLPAALPLLAGGLGLLAVVRARQVRRTS